MGRDIDMLPTGVSRATHGYYRKVIVPALRDHCGYESDDAAHKALKSGFYEMHPDDPNLPSMRDMSKEEATRFLSYALREAAEMSLVIDDARRKA